jgi:polar amino acid transport system substrate-binding protein
MTRRWHLLWRSFTCVAALALAQPVMAQAQSMTFVMENFPPFVLDDNGKGAGPFPEVVRAVCDSMKIQCTLKVLPWRRAYAMAVTGVVDGIFVLARNPEREQSFHFSDPVFQSSFAVFARQAASAYAQPTDLKGFTVATYGPSAVSKEMQELAKTVPMHLEMEIDNQSVLRKLRAGRYPEPAAGVMNKDVGLYIVAQEKLTGLKIAGEFKPIAYGIGL